MLYSDFIRKRIHQLGAVIKVEGQSLTLEKALKPYLLDYKVFGDIYQDVPTEFRKIEYIGGDGNHWIDTGIFPNENMKFEFKYASSALNTSDYPVPFGVGVTQSLSNSILFRQDLMKAKWGDGAYFGIGGTVVPDEIYEGSLEFNRLVFNGIEYLGDCAPISGTFPYSMSLFGFRKGTDGYINSYTKWAGRFYYFKVYEDGELIRDLIPCYRVSDGAIGMYDRVNFLFLTNSGRGTFTKGPDVLPTPENPIPIIGLGDGSINKLNVLNCEDGTIIIESGEDLYAENRCRTEYIYLKAGTYTLSTLGDITFGSYTYTYSSPSQSSWTGTINNSARVDIDNRHIKTFTLTQDCYIREVMLPISGSTITDLNKDTLAEYEPQIEEGDNFTLYDPYKYLFAFNMQLSEIVRSVYIILTGHESLKRIDNVSDTLCYSTQSINRYIGKIDLGTLNWMYNIDTDSFYTSIPDKASGETNIVCTHYPTLKQSLLTDDLFIKGKSNNTVIYLNNVNYTDPVALKQSLQNVYAYYELTSPIEESINLPEISIVQGYSHLYIEDRISLPSNIIAKYQGK